jgi:hypothetical protein
MSAVSILLNVLGFLSPCICFAGLFLLILVGQGWKKSDGSIEYGYIAGAEPTAEDLASRNVPICLKLASNQGEFRSTLSKYPLCLWPGAEGPPIWSYANDAAEYDENSTSLNFDSDSLYLWWSSGDSEWRVWGMAMDGSYAWYKQPSSQKPDESSVPTSSGWKSGYTAAKTNPVSGQTYWDYENDPSFSIELCDYDAATTVNGVPRECYGYIVTSYPVDFTYWPGLILIVLGVCFWCLVIARKNMHEEAQTYGRVSQAAAASLELSAVNNKDHKSNTSANVDDTISTLESQSSAEDELMMTDEASEAIFNSTRVVSARHGSTCQ